MIWLLLCLGALAVFLLGVRKKHKELKKSSAISFILFFGMWIVMYNVCGYLDANNYSEKAENKSYQLIYTLSEGKEIEADSNNHIRTESYFYYTSRDVLDLESHEVIYNKVKAENVKLRMIYDELLSPCVEVYVRYHEPLLSRKDWFWLTLFGTTTENQKYYIIDHYEISVTKDVLDDGMNYIEEI